MTFHKSGNYYIIQRGGLVQPVGYIKFEDEIVFYPNTYSGKPITLQELHTIYNFIASLKKSDLTIIGSSAYKNGRLTAKRNGDTITFTEPVSVSEVKQLANAL